MIRPTVTDKGQVPLPTTRTWTRLDPTLSTAARATPDSRSRHSSQTGRRDVRSKISEAQTTTSPERQRNRQRSEEHTSELPSLMRNSNAVFCWKKKKKKT